MISPAVLADAVHELLILPRVELRETEAGLTLVASGTDDDVRSTVWAWAAKFGAKPTEVAPQPVHDGWSTCSNGWIVAQLPNDVTVIGILHGKKSGRSR